MPPANRTAAENAQRKKKQRADDAQQRSERLDAKRRRTEAQHRGDAVPTPTTAPPRNKFTGEPAQLYKFDTRVLLNTEQPGAQSRLVWTPCAAFTSQTELGTALLLHTGKSHVSERIRDADYRLQTRAHPRATTTTTTHQRQ